jgi:hypothetical protein
MGTKSQYLGLMRTKQNPDLSGVCKICWIRNKMVASGISRNHIAILGENNTSGLWLLASHRAVVL